MKISVTILERHWAADMPAVLFALQTTRNGKPIVLGIAVTREDGRIYSVGPELVGSLPNTVTARTFSNRVESASPIAVGLLYSPWPDPGYHRAYTALMQALNPIKEMAR